MAASINVDDILDVRPPLSVDDSICLSPPASPGLLLTDDSIDLSPPGLAASASTNAAAAAAARNASRVAVQAAAGALTIEDSIQLDSPSPPPPRPSGATAAAVAIVLSAASGGGSGPVASLLARILAAVTEQMDLVGEAGVRTATQSLRATEARGATLQARLRDAEAAVADRRGECDRLRVFWHRDRSEWQPKDSALSCPLCKKEFGVLTWRYHCVVCGICHCGDCARETLVDAEAVEAAGPSARDAPPPPVRGCTSCRAAIDAHAKAAAALDRAVAERDQLKRKVQTMPKRLHRRQALLAALPRLYDQLAKCKAEIVALKAQQQQQDQQDQQQRIADIATSLSANLSLDSGLDSDDFGLSPSNAKFGAAAPPTSSAVAAARATTQTADTQQSELARLRRLAESNECSLRALSILMKHEERSAKAQNDANAIAAGIRAPLGVFDGSAAAAAGIATAGIAVSDLPPAERDRVRTRVARFYSQHCPDGLANVSKLLSMDLTEPELIALLVEKHHVSAADEEADARLRALLPGGVQLDTAADNVLVRFLPEPQKKRLRARLVLFYGTYAPQQQRHVQIDAILEFDHTESAVMTRLYDKYKVDPAVEQAAMASKGLLPPAPAARREASPERYGQPTSSRATNLAAPSTESGMFGQATFVPTFLYCGEQCFQFDEMHFEHLAVLARLPAQCIDDLHVTCTVYREDGGAGGGDGGGDGVADATHEGVTPVHIAAMVGHLELLAHVERQHHNLLYHRAGGGCSAAEFAAHVGNVASLKFLADNGCDLVFNKNDLGATLLHCAVRHIDAFRFLLAAGCDPAADAGAPERGATPLYAACRAGALDAVQCLLSPAVGCSKDLVTGFGVTPLMLATMAPRAKCGPLLRYLAGIGCNLEYRVAVGELAGTSVLDFACMYGEGPAVPELVRLGCKLEATDPQGRTALAIAVLNNRVAAVRALLAAGANRFCRVGGKLLSEIARSAEHHEIAWLLPGEGPSSSSSSLVAGAAPSGADQAWSDL